MAVCIKNWATDQNVKVAELTITIHSQYWKFSYILVSLREMNIKDLWLDKEIEEVEPGNTRTLYSPEPFGPR